MRYVHISCFWSSFRSLLITLHQNVLMLMVLDGCFFGGVFFFGIFFLYGLNVSMKSRSSCVSCVNPVRMIVRRACFLSLLC